MITQNKRKYTLKNMRKIISVFRLRVFLINQTSLEQEFHICTKANIGATIYRTGPHFSEKLQITNNPIPIYPISSALGIL